MQQLRDDVPREGVLLGRLALAAVLCVGALPAPAAEATRSAFGALPDGAPVEAVLLVSPSGVRARVMTYGATLQSLEVPDRNGRRVDVALGYDTAAEYALYPNYFGATIGRFANRIGGAAFTLDGKRHALSANDGRNSLHGGAAGFDKRNWRIVAVESGRAASVRLALRSPDGDQGYPGNLDAEVVYSLDDAGTLEIVHRARTDAPTVVNLTNHSLFNLAGEGGETDVLAQTLTIPASQYTPVDAGLIPTGERRAVAGTPFDFRTPRLISKGVRDGRDAQIVAGRGIDHNYALDAGATADLKLAARLEDRQSGRSMEVWSTEPGLQVYTGNFLAGTVKGKQGHLYRMGDGIALEPQRFPNAPNESRFGSARLDPGQTYEHRMALRFPTPAARP
jgi:aldose 1-epimerase